MNCGRASICSGRWPIPTRTCRGWRGPTAGSTGTTTSGMPTQARRRATWKAGGGNGCTTLRCFRASEERWQQSIEYRNAVRDGVPVARCGRGLPSLSHARESRARFSRTTSFTGSAPTPTLKTERRTAEANAELRERERLAREDAELQKRLLYSLFMQAPTLIAGTSRAAARGRARQSAGVRNLGTHGGRAPEPSAAGCLDGTARPGLSVAAGRGVPHRHSLRRQGDGRPVRHDEGDRPRLSISTSSTPRSGMSKAESRGSLSSHRT